MLRITNGIVEFLTLLSGYEFTPKILFLLTDAPIAPLNLIIARQDACEIVK